MERSRRNLYQFIFLIISIIIILCAMPVQAAYADSDASDTLQYEDEDGIIWKYRVIPAGELSHAPDIQTETIEILGCSAVPKDGVLRIPSSIGGIDVASIGKRAFPDSPGVRNIIEAIIPEHVLIIEPNAFTGCSGMKKLSLPDGLRYISYEGFGSCGVEELTLPDSLEYLGIRSFAWCNNLKTVTLPKAFTSNVSVNEIFYSCLELQEFCLSEQDERYMTDDGVLYSKDGKELIAYPAGKYGASFVVPSNVERLGDYAFAKYRMSEIGLPGGLKSIGENAFSNCINLTAINIPDGVEEIPKCCFEMCNKLETVELNEGLKCIDDYAFEGCVSLKNVNIPKSVNVMGIQIFSNNTSLSRIVIPEGVTEIKINTFHECIALEYISLPDSLISIGPTAFEAYFGEYCALQDLYIPENVQTIADNAFKNHNPFLTIYSKNPVAAAFAEAQNINYVYADRKEYEELVAAGTTGGSCETHNLIYHEEVQATCTSPGMIAYYACKKCGKRFSDPEGKEEVSSVITEKNPHTLVRIAEKAATETEEGNLEYWTCSVCGRVFSDKNGKNQTDLQSMIIPKEPGSGSNDPEDPEDPTQPSGGEDPEDPDKPGETTTGNEGSEDPDKPGETTTGSTGSEDPDKPGETTTVIKRKEQNIDGKRNYTRSIGTRFRLGLKAKTKLTYQSMNKKVATVTRKGVVTVKGYGTCRIRVTAKASGAFKKASRTIIVKGRLAKPKLKASAGTGKVKLIWGKVKGADGYELYFKLPEEKKFRKALTKPAKVKGVMHRGLTRGKKYSYKIRAFKKVGKKTVYSKYSKTVTVTVE